MEEILMIQLKDGSIFKVGDKIRSKISGNKHIITKIYYYTNPYNNETSIRILTDSIKWKSGVFLINYELDIDIEPKIEFPEKWYLNTKIFQDIYDPNRVLLNKWINKNPLEGDRTDYFGISYNTIICSHLTNNPVFKRIVANNQHGFVDGIENYTEITFDQFKKQFLNNE